MKKFCKRFGSRGMAGFLAALIVFLYTGCGAASQNMLLEEAPQEKAAMDTSASASGALFAENGAGMQEAVAEEGGDTDSGTPPEALEGREGAQDRQNARKLIKTVDMNVETKEFDKVLSTIETEVDTLGGYIENMESYNGSAYSGYRDARNSHMTIRIPKEQLNNFLETVSGVCNVVRRSDNVEDVTLTYVDLESHREALRTEQARLLELLERAESIEDIITIESRLSEVRYQLESMESQLRTYDNKIDYSTVYLYIKEVEVLTPVKEETTWERISNGFMGSLENIGVTLKELGIQFLIHLPYLILVLLFVLILIFVIIFSIRRGEKKRAGIAKKQAQKAAQSGMQKDETGTEGK